MTLVRSKTTLLVLSSLSAVTNAAAGWGLTAKGCVHEHTGDWLSTLIGNTATCCRKQIAVYSHTISQGCERKRAEILVNSIRLDCRGQHQTSQQSLTVIASRLQVAAQSVRQKRKLKEA